MRKFILAIACLLFATLSWAEGKDSDHIQQLSVYKSPYCGCCSKWVEHLTDNGFNVSEHNVQNIGSYKSRYGIPQKLGSCHTATIGDYVIEGHVPADDIKRLLSERPDIRGLTVPAMPVGTPGMEQGDRHDPYHVLAIQKDGSTYI